MFEEIILSIQKICKFTEQELFFLTDRLTRKTLQPNAFLLREGQVCRAGYFIKTGALRQYYLDDENSEVTLNLFTENDWVLDIESFILKNLLQISYRHLNQPNS